MKLCCVSWSNNFLRQSCSSICLEEENCEKIFRNWCIFRHFTMISVHIHTWRNSCISGTAASFACVMIYRWKGCCMCLYRASFTPKSFAKVLFCRYKYAAETCLKVHAEQCSALVKSEIFWNISLQIVNFINNARCIVAEINLWNLEINTMVKLSQSSVFQGERVRVFFRFRWSTVVCSPVHKTKRCASGRLVTSAAKMQVSAWTRSLVPRRRRRHAAVEKTEVKESSSISNRSNTLSRRRLPLKNERAYEWLSDVFNRQFSP